MSFVLSNADVTICILSVNMSGYFSHLLHMVDLPRLYGCSLSLSDLTYPNILGGLLIVWTY